MNSKAICHCSEDRCPCDPIIEDDVVTYDDLIEDQVSATKALIEDEEYDFGDVDEPCKGCGTAVSTPLMLMPITVYCNIECFAFKG